MENNSNNEELLKDLEEESISSTDNSSSTKNNNSGESKKSRKQGKKGGKSKKSFLEIDNLPPLGENALNRYSQCLRKLRDTSRHQVELGKAMAEIRDNGLWRVKKFGSFQEWYLEHGYSADEVCNLIAGSRLLEALIEDHGPWVKVGHAMVLLRAREPGVSRLEADIDPLRDIYRSVVEAAEGRVTIKAIKEALYEAELIKRPPAKEDGGGNSSEDKPGGADETADLGPDSEEEKASVPAQLYQPSDELHQARLLAMELSAQSVDQPIHEGLERLLELITAALGYE